MLYRKNIKSEEKEEDGVIRKVGNKWRILKKNRRGYWDAEYDTKEKAQAALRAYWVNKHEYYKWLQDSKNSVNENLFFKDWNNGFLAKLTHYLMTIFGPTAYFDHETENTIELFYKGKRRAELVYNPPSEEIIIIPNDENIPSVSFFDTSEYEIKNYLSDLLLGDLDPYNKQEYDPDLDLNF